MPPRIPRLAQSVAPRRAVRQKQWQRSMQTKPTAAPQATEISLASTTPESTVFAPPTPPALPLSTKARKFAEPRAIRLHRGLYPELYKQSTHGWRPLPEVIPAPARKKESGVLSPRWVAETKKRSDARIPRGYRGIPIFPHRQASIRKTCPSPLATLTASQLTTLDPTGSRTRLFARDNPEAARPGDILLVRYRSGDPFAGVCMNLRRQGVDTAILLRGQLTRVGVEMWIKVYSPLVESIEVVQRAEKRPRRARLTYLRKKKHDRGSVENVVRLYMRQKAAFGAADGKGGKAKAAAAAAAVGRKGKGKGKGKKR